MSLKDVHLHSLYSQNSRMTLEKIKEEAQKKEIDVVALTDHIEVNDSLLKTLNKYAPYSKRTFEIEALKEERFKILNGIEVSDPQTRAKEMLYLSRLPLDIILGSVHDIERIKTKESQIEAAFEKYYLKNIEAILIGNFDVLAHLGYIERYYPDYPFTKRKYIDAVLKSLIEKEIVLEINTSAERNCGKNIFPSFEVLKRYKDLGGERVTTGSDAYRYYEIGDHIDVGTEIARELQLKIGYFEKRKWKQ